MSVDTSTSVASVFAAAPPTPPATMLDEWQGFWRFVKSPHLPAQTRPFCGASMLSLLRLLLLDLSIMVALIAIAGLVVGAGVKLPDNQLNDIELGIGAIAAIVIAAPIFEEVIFRGWLSGKAGHVAAVLVGGTAFGGIALASGNAPVTAALFVFGIVVPAIMLFVTWRRPPMRWFARIFPLFFWLSTLAFALVHLVNYAEGSLLMLLPLVVPQFVAGGIFGYARVTHGLWAGIALHMLHNGTAIGMVLLGSQLTGPQ